MPSRIITGLAYCEKGELLAVRGDGRLFILNTETGAMPFMHRASKGSSQSMAFHPQKDMLAAADGSRIILVTPWSEKKARWQTQTLGKEHGSAVRAIAFNADGRYLASLDSDGYLKVWDRIEKNKGRIIFSWRLEDENGRPLAGKSLSFCPDNRHLAAGAETGEILIYHLLEPDPLARTLGHRDGANALEFSPSGDVLYSAGEDCQIRAWTVPDLKQVKAFTATKDGVGISR